jgi:shikimate kinase
MNVTLIGMSGAGKSYVGREVARVLDLVFFDTDDVLEKYYGKSISELIEQLGEAGFGDAEDAMVVQMTTGKDRMLISTGGSIVYSPSAMKLLHEISVVVYLKAPYELIAQRFEKDTDRSQRIIGLRGKTLHELLMQRAPLYEQYADITVDLQGLDESNVAAEVVSVFHRHLPARFMPIS